MSAFQWLDRERDAFASHRGTAVRRLLLRGLFGDRIGLAVFLGCLCFAGLFWRVGVVINDNITLINALYALADGHLEIEQAVYGYLDAPGTYVADGQLYGRNYGQLVFTLPFLWLVRGLGTVGDLGVALPALWSLTALAFGREVGRALGRERAGALSGSVVALGAFGLNVALSQPISTVKAPLVALQLSAMVATALAAVAMYRLAARMHGARLGIAAGAAVAVATPVGFWASIPKRHVYVAALVLAMAYAFYRSRDPDADGLLSATGLRALTYALVGLATWIHGGEGFVLFLALVLADVPTAPSNDPRTLAVVGGAFALSMVPFLATNELVSGSMIRPPRQLPSYEGGDPEAAAGGASGGTTTGSSGLVSAVLGTATLLLSPLVDGVVVTIRSPERVYETFVRAGYIQNVAVEDNTETINLTVVESMPLAGGLVGIVVAVAVAARSALSTGRTSVAAWLASVRQSPARATDLFVVAVAIGTALIYMPRLPLHAQVTVRYLLVLYPLAVYGLVRLPAVRRALDRYGTAALWTYAIGVLIGTQLLLAVVVGRAFGRGQAIQLHAWLDLAAAAVLGLAAGGAVVDDRFDLPLAVALGAAAALGTAFLLLSGFAYFQYGQYALPVFEWLTQYFSVN